MTTPPTKAKPNGDLESFNSAGDVNWVFLRLELTPPISQNDFDVLMIYILESRQIEFMSGFVPGVTTNIVIAYRGLEIPVNNETPSLGVNIIGDWFAFPLYVANGVNLGILV